MEHDDWFPHGTFDDPDDMPKLIQHVIMPKFIDFTQPIQMPINEPYARMGDIYGGMMTQVVLNPIINWHRRNRQSCHFQPRKVERNV